MLRRALRAGDTQISQEARHLVGGSSQDRWRGEGFRLSGGRIGAQLRALAGANLDAAAQDKPGDANDPQRLWGIRWVAGVRGQRRARGDKSRVGIAQRRRVFKE